MPAPTLISLSKSKFVAGIQCLKRLYLQVHQPGLAARGDEGRETRLEQGHEVGLLARTRFPGGVLVDSANGLDGALAQTAALLDDSSVPAIYEATFRHSNMLVRVDILERRPGNRWRLIEVKSSVEPKPHYLYDLAIQHHVLSNCGLDISSACLMHLNRDYRYNGRHHEPHELFTILDLTKQINELDVQLPALLTAQRDTLASSTPPDISPGPHCTAPYPCEFYAHCNPAPPDHHITLLPRLSEKKHQALIELGIAVIHEIPDDFPLTEIQARVWTSVKTGQTWVSDALRKELSRLECPLYFMDFESLYPAIPRFEGMWPYAQIPFQWSVHRQLAPDFELEHLAFLADDDRDPRPEFINSLCDALGHHGQIVVYNASFESQRLRELADRLPDYRDRIEKIRERLWDLWPFVKRHIYHPAFNGSFSIKAVLPALTGMTYDGMEVAHGGQAGLTWERMIRGEVDSVERRRLREALLAYCCQDTLAMVKILERLSALAGPVATGG